MTALAKFISAIFHPLLVPTYGIILLLGIHTHSILIIPDNSKVFLIAFVFISTFVLPAFVILILKKMGVVTSYQMPNRRERVLPVLIVGIAFFVTYYFLKRVGVFGIISLFMAGSTLIVLLALLINYATKISLHTTAWGGLLGAIIGFSLRYNLDLSITISIVILTIGLITTSRLKLNAHTPFQVYLGFLLGSLSMLGLLISI